MDSENQIKALPKIEQHVHIVGSTKPETLFWIIEDSGAKTPFSSYEDICSFFQYRDFPHFISVYSMVNDCIIDEKYYEKITYEMLESDASCNVKHVEAIFSANDHVRRGLDYGRMLDSINHGIRRAGDDFGITCTIRLDLVRNYGPATGMKALDWVEEKGDNIVAVDIGGSEEGYPPEPYRDVYARARDIGLHLVAHAGEASGPKSIWGAIDVLGVERIGHGVAAASDSILMKALSDRGVTIETCPVSNLRTSTIKTLSEHPIRRFIESGIKVSVSSDDPPMFNTDMNNEYQQLHKELGFSLAELFKISLDSIETSFLTENRKSELRNVFLKEYESLILGD